MKKKLVIDGKVSFVRFNDTLFRVNEDNTHEEIKTEKTHVLVSGVLEEFDVTWLKLMCHYRVQTQSHLLKNFTFLKCTSRVIRNRSGTFMSIKPRIEVYPGFFLIPGFTKHAINREGVVVTLRSFKRISVRISPYGYTEVGLYDSDKGAQRNLCVHILLARTFIENRFPDLSPYVNHIDGNKRNNSLSNLEWVSGKRNAIHAVETSLRPDNKPALVRNIYTGEVTRHPSKATAFESIGLVRGGSHVKNTKLGVILRIFKDTYEIKLESDAIPWSEIRTEKHRRRVLNIGPYQTKDLVTGRVFEDKNRAMLSVRTGISLNIIDTMLKSEKTLAHHGFMIRMSTDAPWPEEFSETHYTPDRSIEVTNLLTGNTVLYPSIRKVCADIGLDKRTLKNRLKTKKPYDSFIFTEKL